MPTVKKVNKPKSKKTIDNGGAAETIKISAWEHDPGSGNQPEGGRLIQLQVPDINSTSLPTTIQNPTEAPAAGLYSPGTHEFRYWNTASALARGSKYWSKLLPGVSWQVGNILPIDLDAGEDLNAFYDRHTLSFFHGMVGSRTIFSCESPDVVCHEQGHAVLDAIKPQLWDAASIEADAFHESFGDISAILSALQLKSVRQGVIAETNGFIYRSSRLSRLAEQVGWAIRQSSPSSVESDCLRNAVNKFFYRDPNSLPSDAPASSLSSETHSFSRVFTAAFFEGLAGMFKQYQQPLEKNLLTVSQDIGQILVRGVQAAAVVPTFFSQVAINMLHFADTLFPSKSYSHALKSAFIRHGIISPACSAIFMTQSAAIKKMKLNSSDTKNNELPKLSLSVSEYALGVDTILVHAASDPKQFDIAGASMAIGSVVPQSEDEAAKAYVEDLLRRGRLKVEQSNTNGIRSFGVSRPNEPKTHETNTHELRLEGNDYVLRRIRIACTFHN